MPVCAPCSLAHTPDQNGDEGQVRCLSAEALVGGPLASSRLRRLLPIACQSDQPDHRGKETVCEPADPCGKVCAGLPQLVDQGRQETGRGSSGGVSDVVQTAP